MADQTISNYHVEYMDVTQHWSAKSETYAGADSLLTLIYNGWKMKKRVLREEHWFAGMRAVNIYHIELEKGDETLVVPVVHNPYIGRLIMQHDLIVEPLEKSS